MPDPFGLELSWNKLKLQWEQTTSTWNDPVAQNFEQTFVIPLEEQMKRTRKELEQLTKVIEQAQRNIR